MPDGDTLPGNEQDISVMGTATDRVRLMLSDEDDARAYMAASFLSTAMLALHDARVAAGLTQEDVARKMGTKQPSIARLENDLGGGVSLRRYVEYALTVGVLPFDFVLEKFETLREFARAHPGEPITQVAFKEWDRQKRNAPPQPTLNSAPENNSSLSMTVAPEPPDRARRNARLSAA